MASVHEILTGPYVLMCKLNAGLVAAVIAVASASCGGDGNANEGENRTTAAGASVGGASGAGGGSPGGAGGNGGAGGTHAGAGSGGSTGGGGANADPLPGSRCNMGCGLATTCEYVTVQCVRAPCPAQPQCVERPSCPASSVPNCPGIGECIDDPRTGCEFDSTVTCPGVCTCLKAPQCMAGQHWNPSVLVCACERD